MVTGCGSQSRTAWALGLLAVKSRHALVFFVIITAVSIKRLRRIMAADKKILDLLSLLSCIVGMEDLFNLPVFESVRL